MYIASITVLSYEVYAIGDTKTTCLNNLLLAFQRYVEFYGYDVEEWIAGCGEDFGTYNNDVLTFLQQYYGYHLFDITKGYAFGWE